MVQAACHEGNSGGRAACPKTAPKVPKDRAPGPEHEPLSETAQSQQELMARLKASGMSGRMFDRESMMAQAQGEGVDVGELGADGGGFGQGDLERMVQQANDGELFSLVVCLFECFFGVLLCSGSHTLLRSHTHTHQTTFAGRG